ncbi:tRNA-(MS[2]IO[6]A)-hydroxylase (MiaE)-like [Jatrophihabitans endophyticus]|uniref:tRNA-(MS[2]IO[6]A)-hydroxylase (MiaE)-like n=1 Tax=Jatrophihabitans endophyticus TaxID=1206085 RepID=A0A1M5EVH4_9ACTN|nr:ferritin-like fold-containing protein [Jatrophihabitans endophyticus]SHF83179.1 tRNA-(MS[2]IO[6]A)-hydroxylase (MiaE)-like [Jatrophihabitans endophyticus]
MPSPDAVVDLLGVLAYGELSAFDRLADDARMAPDLAGRAEMSAMAAVEFGHYRLLADRLVALGADPAAAMDPFTAALETYHSLTEPSTWLEGVVKAYVGDGIAADFYREVAAFVDAADRDTADLIRDVLAEGERAAFAVREVKAAVAERPAVSGRLALWARRLVGEAISQAQHVLADRDSLMLLLVEGSGDLAGVATLISRLTDRHEERMTALGLSS